MVGILTSMAMARVAPVVRILRARSWCGDDAGSSAVFIPRGHRDDRHHGQSYSTSAGVWPSSTRWIMASCTDLDLDHLNGLLGHLTIHDTERSELGLVRSSRRHHDIVRARFGGVGDV